jgi:hypothetical protein
MKLEYLNAAKHQIEEILKENISNDIDIRVEQIDGELVLIFHDGKNLKLSMDEVEHQAIMHYESKIEEIRNI